MGLSGNLGKVCFEVAAGMESVGNEIPFWERGFFSSYVWPLPGYSWVCLKNGNHYNIYANSLGLSQSLPYGSPNLLNESEFNLFFKLKDKKNLWRNRSYSFWVHFDFSYILSPNLLYICSVNFVKIMGNRLICGKGMT